MCICGCSYTSPIIQRVIVSDLKTRYGLDFNIISIVNIKSKNYFPFEFKECVLLFFSRKPSIVDT